MANKQFNMQPEKSTSVLNNDPKWNKFIRFDSDYDGELNAYFKRDIFEAFVLRTAYEQRRVSFKSIEESNGYEFVLHVFPILTTYLDWAKVNEPIIKIMAKVISPFPISGANHCAFEYTYYVRAPYEGYIRTSLLSSFHEKQEINDGLLYRLYSPNRTKELWPHFEQFGSIYDNPDRLDYIHVRFNEYKYDTNFWEGIPYYDFEAEVNSPSLRYEWEVDNFSYVSKEQHICTIIKHPNCCDRKEYKIYSPASGIITLSLNGESRNFGYQEEIQNCNELFLFSVYKNRDSLMMHHYYFIEDIEEDKFDGTISLSWETGRRLLKCEEDESYLDDYPGLEMKAEMGKYIVVSLELKNNIPYIVFSVDSKKIRLTSGDSIDMLFDGTDGYKKVLNFPITKNSVKRKVSNVFDNSFYCELSQEDVYCMMNYDCLSWRVQFGKQPFMSVLGSNESIWCPKEYASDVFKSFASQFVEVIEELKNEYSITFSSRNNSKPTVATNDTCFVYLMYDTSNGYFKIGISNDPEYRERTLQSEKPTIEKICAKEFPNRIIASAIESALHKAYESKRLRGEWFALDASDVNAIITTLR